MHGEPVTTNEGLWYLPQRSLGADHLPLDSVGAWSGEAPEAESLLNLGGPKESQNLQTYCL